MSGGAIASEFLVAKSNGKVPVKFVKPATVGENADTKMASKESQGQQEYKMTIVWLNVAVFTILHSMALYGLYFYFTAAKIQTMIILWIHSATGAVGVTAGAHRLWAHRTYKAKLPMRIILMLMQCMAHQNCIYEWVRDHRLHHKYTDTDADPHNSRRGFFFSHMGWLVVKKHPEILRRGKGIDMSDVGSDPVIAFQKKYFYILMPVICFFGPTLIPVYFWNESIKVSFFITILRYTMSLHYTWLVNSAAHLWGYKPYDKNISPTDNAIVSLLAHGEGWHNYHHAFPWDYKAAELGRYWLNTTTMFIDFFAALSLAYDLKTVPLDMVIKRAEKSGDGTRKRNNERRNSHEGEVWGWDDKDMRPEDKQDTKILSRQY